jgi:hypothetical protein
MKKVSRNEIERKISDIRERVSDRATGSGTDPDAGGDSEKSGADEARAAMIGRKISSLGTNDRASVARNRMLERRGAI